MQPSPPRKPRRPQPNAAFYEKPSEVKTPAEIVSEAKEELVTKNSSLWVAEIKFSKYFYNSAAIAANPYRTRFL